MARSINKVTILGNLGQDPEIRHMPSGDMVANFSVATTDVWKDKQTGQKQERTEWHKCGAFGKLAEIIQQYLKKGSKIYVEGQLQTRKWQAQDGTDRYSTEIKVRDMVMLDSPGGGQQQGGYQQPPPQQGYPQQQPPQQDYRGHPGGNQPNPTYGNPPPQQQPPQGQQPPPQQPPQGQPQYTQQGHGQQSPGPGGFSDFDDEIPFAPMHNMAGG